jgi:glutathione S-transferase
MENKMLKLFIGNKNYSSWSMRPWVLLKQSGILFEEVMVPFDAFGPDSAFKKTVTQLTPTGKVPVLQDGSLAVWDTLAIAEYAAEYAAAQNPPVYLWPTDRAAQARSICAEMHTGFTALRSHCPMNIEADLANIGAILWRDQPAVRADVAYIVRMWSALLAKHGGPMLFGNFSVADAYFAPVVTRLRSYALPVPAEIAAYMECVWALPGVQAWVQGALAEKSFVDFDEPYRLDPHAPAVRGSLPPKGAANPSLASPPNGPEDLGAAKR